MNLRIGFGFDVHRLVAGRQLILGGVAIPFETGLLGHSDADVLSHAIGDALLGAAALGDLGKFFPAESEQYRNISSLILLQAIVQLVEKSSYQIVNIDTTIVAQQPRISPHIDRMKQNIAAALQIAEDQISIKATTTEGLGFEGLGQGIAAYAVALLKRQ